MAFPALGLAKIVWAVDIILDMNLPGFSPEALHGQTSWHDLLGSGELASGETRRIECDGRAVFVHRAGDDWHVYDSRCPHQTTDIPHLALQGHTLTCPKHQWAFDIRSGECTAKGNSPLRRWPSQVEQGRVMARW
jgi:nitrite reductase/ring-hydroxylating ferredoxin subunit